MYDIHIYIHTVPKQAYRISVILKLNGEEWFLGGKVPKKTP